MPCNISFLLFNRLHSSSQLFIPFPLPTCNYYLFSISVSLFLLCHIHSFVLFFRLHVWVFVLLCLTYFTKHNTLQVHSHCCKWQNFNFFLNGSVIFHSRNIPHICIVHIFYSIHIYTYIYVYIYICAYIPHLSYPFICW